MWFLIASGTANAGYADAVAGLPTYDDRDTFFWTNAVRVDPASFDGEYPCSFSSFQASEQTPKATLRYNADLTEAASFHSNDMNDEDYFDHDSIDGTPWNVRIARYYPSPSVGENIGWGYGTPYSAVIDGWMCSSGHRSNIMSTGYNELGAGVAGVYYTQDFGNGSPPQRVMSMGLHLPENPSNDVDLVVDWDAAVGPDALYVVLDGVRHDLALVLGEASRGIYGVTVPAGSGCQAYYFVGEVGSASETWPEDGSYGYGGCSFDDPAADWLDDQIPLPSDTTTDPTGTGTETDPGSDPNDPSDPTDPGTTTSGSTAPTSPAGCGCRQSGSAGGIALIVLLAMPRRRSRFGLGAPGHGPNRLGR